jgi:hypothetical protein
MRSGTTLGPRLVQAFALAAAAVLMAAGLFMLADASTIRRELEGDRVLATRGLSLDTRYYDRATQELSSARRALQTVRSREPESALDQLIKEHKEIGDAQAVLDRVEAQVKRERYRLDKLHRWRSKLGFGRALAAAAIAISVFVIALHLPPPRLPWFPSRSPAIRHLDDH